MLRAAMPRSYRPGSWGAFCRWPLFESVWGRLHPRDKERGNKPMFRTFFSSVTCAVLVSALAAVSAQAAGGCGPGFHRGLLGVCVANGPAVIVGAPAVVVAPAAPAVVVAAPAPAVVVAPAARRWWSRRPWCAVGVSAGTPDSGAASSSDHANFMKMGRPAPAHLSFRQTDHRFSRRAALNGLKRRRISTALGRTNLSVFGDRVAMTH